jgi:DNA-nicking Smr family endonuclease
MAFFFDFGLVVLSIIIVYVTNFFTQPWEELSKLSHWKIKFGLATEEPFTPSKRTKQALKNEETLKFEETNKFEPKKETTPVVKKTVVEKTTPTVETKPTPVVVETKPEPVTVEVKPTPIEVKVAPVVEVEIKPTVETKLEETKEVVGSSKEENSTEESTLSIPNKLHQYCIGKGGSIIKEISSASGCKLNFNGDSVELKGDSSSREKATKLIMESLSNVGWFFENNEWVERTKQDELWKQFRGEAQKEVELRNECFEKSKKAFEEGDKELASKLSEEGKMHNEKWKQLTVEAGKNIFNEMNKNNERTVIDLHGLFVDEALGFVKERLAELKGSSVTLSVITGAGNHSEGGQALIKPKIIQLLTDEKLTFQEEKNGQIDVNIE